MSAKESCTRPAYAVKDCCSPYKLLHHGELIQAVKRGEAAPPAQVTFGITNICNHRCPYCYPKGRYAERDRAQMDTSRTLALLDEISDMGVKVIQITGAGEPSIHPGFREIVKKADRTGLRSGFVMNGSGLSLSDVDLFGCADWIRFSVDAATGATYERIHGADSFHKVLSLIESLATRWPNALIGMSFVVTPDNYHEIFDAACLARSSGCKLIRYIPVHTAGGIHIFEGIWDRCRELVEQASTLDTPAFHVSAQMDRFFFRRNTEKNFSRCYYQHFSTYIGADGSLYPCCLLQGARPLGSLHDRSLRDLWHGRTPIGIDECTAVCSFTRQNELMEYLMQEKPLHVEYV
ncbi:MAG: radical SAM protein [Thermodesulfovibrionales bacterium]